jgi:hypothetical protein
MIKKIIEWTFLTAGLALTVLVMACAIVHMPFEHALHLIFGRR